MKYSSRAIGLFQAAGLTLYVSLFASCAYFIGQWAEVQGIKPAPVVAMIIFLLAFVISAAISGSIMFGYPAFLFFGNKKDEAIKIILWSLVWLVAIFIIFLVGNFILL